MLQVKKGVGNQYALFVYNMPVQGSRLGKKEVERLKDDGQE